MASGLGDKHAARAPPEIGGQNNQGSIAKVLRRIRRCRGDGFYERCMLGVEGQHRKSARRSSALVSPRYRLRTPTPAMTLARPETRFDRCSGSTFRLPNIRHTTDKDRRAPHRHMPLLFAGAFGRPFSGPLKLKGCLVSSPYLGLRAGFTFALSTPGSARPGN